MAIANLGGILANIKAMVKDNLKIKKRVVSMKRKETAETAISFTVQIMYTNNEIEKIKAPANT